MRNGARYERVVLKEGVVFAVALGHVARGGDIGELCFRIALAPRRTGRWLRSSHVRPRLLPAGAPCLHGGGQVPRERSRHPVGFRDVRLPGGREYPATAPGSFRILFFLKKTRRHCLLLPPSPSPFFSKRTIPPSRERRRIHISLSLSFSLSLSLCLEDRPSPRGDEQGTTGAGSSPDLLVIRAPIALDFFEFDLSSLYRFIRWIYNFPIFHLYLSVYISIYLSIYLRFYFNSSNFSKRCLKLRKKERKKNGVDK